MADFFRSHKPNASWTKHNRFYSSTAWRKVRAVKLERNPACESCENVDLYVPATEVDHIIPMEDCPDPLDLDNLQSLCTHCHRCKTIGTDPHKRLKGKA